MRSRVRAILVAGALISLVATCFVLLPQLFGNGVAVTPAAPTDSTAAPAATDRLLQADDLRRAGLHLAGSQRWQAASEQPSGCTGAESMAELTGSLSPDDRASASWRTSSTPAGDQTLLRESIARAPSLAAADRYDASLINRLRRCIDREHGRARQHLRPATLHTRVGRAVRFVAYDSYGHPVGGVDVFQKGTTFGVLDLDCSDPCDPDQGLGALGAAALLRIA